MKFNEGFYAREIIGILDIELVRSFEWMDEEN